MQLTPLTIRNTLNTLTPFATPSTEDRAVSPVVGVVLMVAITVLLASIIGTFTLGMSDRIETSPQAAFEYDHVPGAAFTVTHGGGDGFDRLEVFVDGTKVDDWAGPIGTGDSFTSTNTYTSGTVMLVWTDTRSGRTAVVSKHDL